MKQSNFKDTDHLFVQAAERLTKLYFALKPSIELRRSLKECIDREREKTKELRQLYNPALNEIKFLKADYFKEFNQFNRFQDIPNEYFISSCDDFYFISHRWLSSEHTDLSGCILEKLKNILTRT